MGLKLYLNLAKLEKTTVNGVENETGREEHVESHLKEHRLEKPTELPQRARATGHGSYEYGREKDGVKAEHKNGVDTPEAVLVL